MHVFSFLLRISMHGLTCKNSTVTESFFFKSRILLLLLLLALMISHLDTD